MLTFANHVINDMLPENVKNNVQFDCQQSTDALMDLLRKLEDSKEDYIDPTIIPVISRTISEHMMLKYPFDVSLKSYAASTLLSTFLNKKLPLQMKSKLLASITQLISQKHEKMDFKYSWKLFWDETLDLVMREKKYESVAADDVKGSYIYYMIDFMHAARRFNSVEDANAIVAEAMSKFIDMRTSVCIEGVLLLLTCLPTDFDNYDKYLPQWLSVWTSIENNLCWDDCWLTIFARARKFSKSFNWSLLNGLLVVKLRRFLGINGRGDSYNQYPRAVPRYYYFYFGRQFDEKRTGVSKISKLMYFLTMRLYNSARSLTLVKADPITTTPVDIPQSFSGVKEFPGYNAAAMVTPEAAEFCLFLQSLRNFFYPSNTGNWTQLLAVFMTNFVDEICHHVGIAYASKIFGNRDDLRRNPSHDVFSGPFHTETLSYVIGCIISLLIEGLYGKSPAMVQSCSNCLKNIISIDPSYVDIFLPLFLSALDSEAVTQAHQALAALQSLIVSFKSFLFPKPVILDYLPQLLRLSLPGIDPGDQMKTAITLKFYSTVFSWIPVRSDYKAVINSNENMFSLQQLSCEKPQKSTVHRVDSSLAAGFDTLASIWVDWIPQFWERIVLILNISEERNKGNKNQHHLIAGSIAECCGHLFRSLKSGHENRASSDDYLYTLLENKIIECCIKSSNYHSGKTLSKILRALGANNPSSVTNIFSALINDEVLNLSCSNEKLAFRLFLIAGICRSAGDALLPHSHQLLSIIGNDKYALHSEKDVRKAYNKLVKNVLRGLTATYTTYIAPAYQLSSEVNSAGAYILGSPNPMGSGVVSWYIPNPEALAIAIRILNITVSESMGKVKNILLSCDSFDAVAAEGDVSQSFKKIEESITMYIKLIQKALRGAAEILGDDMTLFTSADTSSSKEDEDQEKVLANRPILSSGRYELIDALAEESDRNFLRCIRRNVLEWLLDIKSKMECASPNAKSQDIPSDSASPSVPSFQGLVNSTPIVKGWLKTLRILISFRMSHFKDINQTKNGMENAINTQTSAFVRSVQRYIVRNLPQDTSESQDIIFPFSQHVSKAQNINNVEYWMGHDLPASYIAQSVTLHFISRIHVFAATSARKFLKKTQQGRLFIDSLYAVAALSCHEYDGIRHYAVGVFDNISAKFGSVLNSMILDLLWGIESGSVPVPPQQRSNSSNDSNAGITYSVLAGNFSLLRQNRIVSRIVGDGALTFKYLSVIIETPAYINKVLDPEKRDRLDRHYMDSFTKYASKWIHLTSPEKSQQHNQILMKCLERLGSIGANTDNSFVANSFKHDSVLAYLVLHYIGRAGVDVPITVWKWAVETVTTSHGQPVQMIAIAVLVKLTYMAYHNPHQYTEEVCNLICSIDWPKFLHGLSLTHPKESNASNGWVSALLESSFNVSSLLSRKIYCDITEDTQNSGPKLQKRYLILLSSIMTSCTHSTTGVDNDRIISFVSAALNAGRGLVNTSEVEIRANNATKAELFGGIYQAYFHKFISGTINSSLWLQIERLLVDFMIECTQNLSTSQSYEWTDAVYFSYFQIPISWEYYAANSDKSQFILVNYIVDNFKIAVASTDEVATSSGNGNGIASDNEGFVRHQKSLLFLRSLLAGDLTSGINFTVPAKDTPRQLLSDSRTRGSVIAQIVYDFLNDSNSSKIDSKFHYIRAEIASIIGFLDCFAPKCQRLNLMTIAERLDYTISAEIMTEDATSQQSQVTKQRSEVAMFWLRNYIYNLFYTYDEIDPVQRQKYYAEVIAKLLSLVIESSGHSEIDFAKTAHGCTIQAILHLAQSRRYDETKLIPGTSLVDDLIGQVLLVLRKFVTHDSWHVRETVAVAANLCMTINWSILTAGEKKYCKDLMVELQSDMKPEVQNLAVSGMMSYLTNKTSSELLTLATAYIKNCDTLAVRESKRRKQSKDGSDGVQLLTPLSDKSYWSTIFMAVCLIRAFPYDMPSFLPNLVAALIKHLNYLKDKTFIAKTIQDFKRSHQDKWTQFSALFTREQLDDLQGTGAAHYFA